MQNETRVEAIAKHEFSKRFGRKAECFDKSAYADERIEAEQLAADNITADPLTPVADQMAQALREVRDHLYTTQDIHRVTEASRNALAAYEKLTGEKC